MYNPSQLGPFSPFTPHVRTYHVPQCFYSINTVEVFSEPGQSRPPNFGSGLLQILWLGLDQVPFRFSWHLPMLDDIQADHWPWMA